MNYLDRLIKKASIKNTSQIKNAISANGGEMTHSIKNNIIVPILNTLPPHAKK
jgi:hypothetical protein